MAHTFTDNEVATKANLDTLLPPSFAQCGSVSITPVTNTPTSMPVIFPVPFSVAPTVVVTPNTLAIGSELKTVSVSNITATSFTAWVYRSNTTKLTLNWQAWGAAPAAFTDADFAYQSLLNAASSAKLVTKTGTVSITPVANTPTVGAVSFAAAFSAVPNVVVCPVDTLIGSQVKCCGISSVTAAGFNARVYRTNTTATTLAWIALGRT